MILQIFYAKVEKKHQRFGWVAKEKEDSLFFTLTIVARLWFCFVN